MNYKEFGSSHSKTIFLLHGGGLSWWNYREETKLLQNEYRVIVPFLDGHAGSDNHFTTIENNAQDIISFINKRFHGSVDMICGLSLGGQIVLEMLSQKSDICRYAIIESAMAIPSKLTNALIQPAFGFSYPLIKQRWFAKLQFRQLRINDKLFEDYYRDTCDISKKDMIAFMKANTSYQMKESIRNCTAEVHIYYGSKENSGIKKSADFIQKYIHLSDLTELAGMYHGDFSINHPDDFVKAIKSFDDKF